MAFHFQELPIAIIGFRDTIERDALVREGVAEAKQVPCGYSFLGGMNFHRLLSAYELLNTREMWMGAIVLEHAPTHLYFDFDAGLSKRADRQQSAAQALAHLLQGKEEEIKQEFRVLFEAFFAQTFARLPNWTGLHWECASDSTAGKVSLHAHLTTEAFADVTQCRAFMMAFEAFVDQRHRAGEVKWLQLALDDDVARLLDTAVYTPNRVFRLIGCSKPFKTPLCPLPSTEAEAQLTWEDLIFRGMPSLSLDVDATALLSFTSLVPLQSRKRPSLHLLSAPSAAEQLECTTAQELNLLHKIFQAAGLLGPEPRIRKCRTIDNSVPINDANSNKRQRCIRRFQGEFEVGTAWCPRRGSQYVHEHTPVAFVATIQTLTLTDFACGVENKTKIQANAQLLVTAGIDIKEWCALFHEMPAPPLPSPMRIIEILDEEQSVAPLPPRSPVGVAAAAPVAPTATPMPGTRWQDALPPDELQPSRSTLQKIVALHRERHASTADELRLRAHQEEPDESLEREVAALDASLSRDIVQYCNRYWARVLRAGKPYMVQELGKRDVATGRVSWKPHFNLLLHLSDMYSFLTLPSFSYTKSILPPVPQSRRRKQQSVDGPVPVAKLWFHHPASRKVNCIIFNPQLPVTLLADLPDADEHTCDYNLWKGFAVMPAQANSFMHSQLPRAVSAEMLCAPLLQHILQVWCRGDANVNTYVLSWMANILQKRVKNGTALVLKGTQGAGKGIVVMKLAEVVGCDHFFQAHNLDDVMGTYTHNLRAAILVFLDEVIYGGNSEQAERCKKLVTEPTHMINAKYEPSYTVDSYLNVIIASNGDFVVPCELRQRRFLAMEVQSPHAGPQGAASKAYYDAILAVPKEAFAAFLYQYDISTFNPRAIHSTPFERDQKVRSFDPMLAWWHECLQSGTIDGAFVVRAPFAVRNCDEAFQRLAVKDSIYQSFFDFCNRNHRGRTYQIQAKHAFWKKLEEWTRTEEREKQGLRLTHPEMKITLSMIHEPRGGAAGEAQEDRVGDGDPQPNQPAARPIRVVRLPSLQHCRDAFKNNIAQDANWVFESIAG